MPPSSTLAAPEAVVQLSTVMRPWDHGRLKVDASGRNLIHEDGHPFFWNGDSCWELIHRSTREEVDKYLADRAAKRFNVIQPVAVAEFGAFDVPNRYGHLAFNPSALFPRGDMGCPRVGPGENDDYWDHVDYVIDRAAEHGIYVCLVVTWASYISPAYAVDESNAYTFGQFIGNRYKDRPNVIYMLGCDRDAEVAGVDYRGVWRLMGTGIKDADPNHLMSFLTKYFDARHWFEGESWLDFNMIQYRAPKENWDVHNLVSTAYAKSPAMPAINVECNLEGDCGADVCRREFYWYVFSGAFGHTYGHLAMITWWDSARPYWTWFKSPTIGWRDALGADGACEKLHARNLMESRPLIGRVPDPQLIAVGHTEFVHHLEACRGEGYAFVYTPTGKSFAVNMGRISGERVNAWWFDPRTGEASKIGTYANRGSRTFTAPGEAGLGNDWVLVLDDAACGYAAPGLRDFPQHLHLDADLRPAPVHAGAQLRPEIAAWALNGAEAAPQASSGVEIAMSAGDWKSAEQCVAVLAKQRYTLTANARSVSRKGEASITAICLDKRGNELSRRWLTVQTDDTTSPLARHGLDFITPASACYVTVRLASHEGGAGTVYFSDISLSPATSNQN